MTNVQTDLKSLVEESKKVETDLRRFAHAPDCEADPNDCPRGCSCNPKLDDFTAILWQAAKYLKRAREFFPVHTNLFAVGVSTLFNTAIYHHNDPKDPRVQALDRAEVVLWKMHRKFVDEKEVEW